MGRGAVGLLYFESFVCISPTSIVERKERKKDEIDKQPVMYILSLYSPKLPDFDLVLCHVIKYFPELFKLVLIQYKQYTVLCN